MGAPTPIHFLRRFSKAASSDGQTHVLSKYFIELAAIDYKLSEYLPSEVSIQITITYENNNQSMDLTFNFK